MEYLSQNTFTQASITDDSQQFFIRLWCELFNSDTIDSYRVRVMNAHSILKELEEVINDKLSENIISMNHINCVAREAERILSEDKICQEHFKYETDFTIKNLKSLYSNNLKEQDLYPLLSKTKILSLILEEKYFNLLFDELHKSIFVSKVSTDIQILTKALATELIWRGFSFSYLYNRKAYFLDHTRSFAFQDKFQTFRNDVENIKRNFKVIIKFSATRNISNFPNIFNFNISDTFTPVNSTPEETEFDTQRGTFYGEMLAVISADPYSSVYTTIKRLSLLQNLVRYEYRKNEFQLSPLILVYDLTNNNTYLIEAYPTSLGFVPSGNNYRFNQYIDYFNTLLDNAKSKLDKTSIDRLMNSFHYFRMSLDSPDPETRFLLNWIAFEYLIKIDTKKSLIEKITNFIPKMLATQYLNKLFKDLSANTLRLRCNRTVLEGIGFGYSHNKYQISSIFDSIKIQTKLTNVLANINDQLLNSRYQEFADLVTDHKKLEDKINFHREDVEWHLQRIYRARNKIVHSASTHLDLIQLDGNLSYYFTTVFNNVLYSAVNSINKISLDDIFFEYEAKYELMMHKIKKGNVTSELLKF